MSESHEAITAYRKGIEILMHDQNRHQQSNDLQAAQLAEKQRASAHACIAELYMTPPLCDEQGAEQTCEAALQESLKIDGENLDALQCLANLRSLRERDQEAFSLLQKIVIKLTAIHDHIAESTCVENIDKPQSQTEGPGQMPSIDFRLQTARLLVQLGKYKPAVQVLEMITKEDDEVIEAWYLLAFSFYKRQKWHNAKECCVNIYTTHQKLKLVPDKEMETATREIFDGVNKELKKLENQSKSKEAGDDMYDSNSGFEDCSDDSEMSSDTEAMGVPQGS